MIKYKQIYLDSVGKTREDIFLCEVCRAVAVDIHHVEEKGMGGRPGADVEENLIALCRRCHDDAHASLISKPRLKAIVRDRIRRINNPIRLDF